MAPKRWQQQTIKFKCLQGLQAAKAAEYKVEINKAFVTNATWATQTYVSMKQTHCALQYVYIHM